MKTSAEIEAALDGAFRAVYGDAFIAANYTHGPSAEVEIQKSAVARNLHARGMPMVVIADVLDTSPIWVGRWLA